jgi:hypothetical protein
VSGLPERSCVKHRDAALDADNLDLAVEWDELLRALKSGHHRLTIVRKMVLLLALEAEEARAAEGSRLDEGSVAPASLPTTSRRRTAL